MPIPTLPGITAKIITTDRISTRVLFSGPDDGVPVLFLHGNVSSATWWEETMLALSPEHRGIAPDQRGFGEAEFEKKIDATRGMGDLVGVKDITRYYREDYPYSFEEHVGRKDNEIPERASVNKPVNDIFV